MGVGAPGGLQHSGLGGNARRPQRLHGRAAAGMGQADLDRLFKIGSQGLGAAAEAPEIHIPVGPVVGQVDQARLGGEMGLLQQGVPGRLAQGVCGERF